MIFRDKFFSPGATMFHLKCSFLRVLLVCVFFSTAGGVATTQAQIFPLSENSWNNPEFVKRFLGSYGVLTRLEPEISREEAELFQRLIPLLETQMEEAVRQLTAAITPESSAALDYTLASLHLQSGNSEAAIRHYRAAIRKFPNFLRAYKNLGLSHVQAGQFQEALPMLVKSIELGDGHGDTYGLLGFTLLNLGRFRSAVDAYRMAYVLRPENRDWKVGLAQSLNQAGFFDQAASVLLELIEEDPQQVNFWLTRANALISLNREQEAAKHLEMVRRMGRANPSTLMLLGDIYMNMQMPNLAVTNYLQSVGGTERLALTSAMRVARILTNYTAWEEAEAFIGRVFAQYEAEIGDEDRTTLLNYQAEIALATGRQEEAASILESVVALDPFNGNALLLLADFYARRGEFEDAAFYFQRVENLRGFEAEAKVQFARMRVIQRDFSAAVRLLEEAQRIRPRANVENYLIAVRNARDATR